MSHASASMGMVAVCLTGMERSFAEIGGNIREGLFTALGSRRAVFFGVRPPKDEWPSVRRHDWASSGHHLNRFGSAALQLYKHLSNGEGGSVPAGGLALLRDPEGYGRPLIDRGVCLCCDGRTAKSVAFKLSF